MGATGKNAGHESKTGWEQSAPSLGTAATRRAVSPGVCRRALRSCLLVLALVGGVHAGESGGGGLRTGASGSGSGACVSAGLGPWGGRGGAWSRSAPAVWGKEQSRSGGLASLRGGGKLHPLSYPWLAHNWMDTPEYYVVLGVAEDASYQDIKDVYRREVLSHHPDREGAEGEGGRFIAVRGAWEVLGDADARAAYDTHLTILRDPARPGPHSPERGYSSPTPQTPASPKAFSFGNKNRVGFF